MEEVIFTSLWSDTWEVPTWVTNIDILVVAWGWGAWMGGSFTSGGWGWGAWWVIYIENYSVTPSDIISLTIWNWWNAGTSPSLKWTNWQNTLFWDLIAIWWWWWGTRSNRSWNNWGSGWWAWNFANSTGSWGNEIQTSQSGDSWTFWFGNNWASSAQNTPGGWGGAGWPAPSVTGTGWTPSSPSPWWPWIFIFWETYAKGWEANSNWNNWGNNTGNWWNARAVNSASVWGSGGSWIIIIRYGDTKKTAWFLMRNF